MGYGKIEISILGTVYIIAGAIGGFLMSLYITKYKNFVWPLRILLIVSILGFVGLAFSPSYVFLMISSVIAGIGSVGFIPVATEAIMEQGYPVSESVSNNAVCGFAQVLGL